MNVEDRAAIAEQIEAEIAEVCGVMNASTARLVHLVARVLETESWQEWGIRSASHWVAWKCGLSPARAHGLVLMARKLADMPVTRVAFEEGRLCEDQVAVVCRHAPRSADADAAALADVATVVQLRRVLGSYPFDEEAKVDPTEPSEPGAPPEPRKVNFGTTERGTWRLSADLPPDEGALVERALVTARDELFQAGEEGTASEVAWADAFVAMADRSLGGATRPHHERNLVLLHVGTAPDGSASGHLHLGQGSARACATSWRAMHASGR